MLRFIFVLTLANTAAVQATELQQPDGQHQLTLYQANLAMVSSTFTPPAQSRSLSFNGLPASLLPESVRLSGLSIAQQQWIPGRSFEQRLQARVGQPLTMEHIESAEIREGRLLGVNANMLEFEYQTSVMRYPLMGPWQPRLPAYDPSQTQLTLNLVSALERSSVELNYLSNGLSWSAEYQIELQGETQVHLNARAALFNRGNAGYRGAGVDLLAGNPRSPQEIQPLMEMRALAAAPIAETASVAEVQGYQLFQLPGRYDLEPGTSQRVPLIEAQGLPAKVSYRIEHRAFQGLRPGVEQHYAQQQLNFELDEALIDKPLPSGEAQLFKRDSVGQLRFVGSQRLGQYSPGQSIELNYGEVFDLRAERRQTEYQRNGNTFLQGYEVRLINGAAESRVLEYRLDVNEQWTLVDASQLATVDGLQARWLIEVPAKSETTLNYTLRLVR